MEDFVIFYNTDAKTGVVTETKHYLTAEEKSEAAKANIQNGISMRQARLALLQAGLLEKVNQAIANGNEADKISWEYATEVQRSDSLVQNLASGLGLSEQDLDNLFLLASGL